MKIKKMIICIGHAIKNLSRAVMLCIFAFSFIFLSACNSSSSGGSSSATKDESVGIFFREGQVLSYNEENDSLVSRGNFDDDLFIALNTYADTPHSDFGIFAADGELLSVNYLSGRIISLGRFDGTICELNLQETFSDDDGTTVKLSRQSFIVVSSSDPDCLTDLVYSQVQFSVEEFSNSFTDGDDFLDIDDITVTAVDEGTARYTIALDNSSESDEDRKFGFLSYDPENEELALLNTEGAYLWTYNVSGVGNNATLKRLDNDIVFIRFGTEVYLIETSALFDANFFSGGGSVVVPSDDDVDELFASVSFSVSGNPMTANDVTSNGKALLYIDNASGFYLPDSKDPSTPELVFSAPAGALYSNVDLISPTRIVLKHSFADLDELFVLRYDEPNLDIIWDTAASEIEFAVYSNSLYFNWYNDNKPVSDQTETIAFFMASTRSTPEIGISSAQWLVPTNWKGEVDAPMLAAYIDDERYIYPLVSGTRFDIDSSLRIGPIPLDERFAFSDHRITSSKIALINYANEGNIESQDLNTHVVELDDLIIGRSVE